MKTLLGAVSVGLLIVCSSVLASEPGTTVPNGSAADLYVQVSPADPHYFQLSDGSPYIPIGLNLAGPGFDSTERPERRMAQMESWMRSLAGHRGNFIRIWMGQDFFDVEHEHYGQYDEQKLERLTHILRLAGELGIRVKLCMEHFRRIHPELAASRTTFSNKALYHRTLGGKWEDMSDFLTSPAGRAQFKRKMTWWRDRLGNNPTIFAWELWNEMDAVATTKPEWMDWTEEMISVLRGQFPQNLVTQSLGSFDKPWKIERYRWLAGIAENDVVQVHRYLDLGAELGICRGPMDELAADAVATMRTFGGAKPILLAETGGVQPRHSGGPFELCDQDRAGIILHDALFAPFFAGAAGPGHVWFWDEYVHRNQLWYHFGRFAEAVKGIDPAKERFVPQLIENSRLRVYVRDGLAPQPVTGLSLDLFPYVAADADFKVEFYDPWTNTWCNGVSAGRRIALPAFTRSLVVRVTRAAAL